jgi:hypothetical protein
MNNLFCIPFPDYLKKPAALQNRTASSAAITFATLGAATTGLVTALTPNTSPLLSTKCYKYIQ